MALIYDIFVGSNAPLLSGVCGLVGSAFLAVPPMWSWGIRKAALIFNRLKDSRLFGKMAKKGGAVATENLMTELKRERRYNVAGAVFLFVSFLLLILHALWGQGT